MSLRKRLILLEDDEALRWNMEHTLAHFGFDVVATANASEFTAAINNGSHYDLMVTDLNLGETGFDGFKAISMIREKEPALPVIMLTGESNARKLTPDHLKDDITILYKPFSFLALERAFEKFGFNLK